MLGAGDWSQMEEDLLAIRDDNSQEITIRRGGTTLPAQTVRIVRMGGAGRHSDGSQMEASTGQVLVVGASDLNIRPDDRFTDANSQLYEVVLIRQNRRAGVQAEATVIT